MSFCFTGAEAKLIANLVVENNKYDFIGAASCSTLIQQIPLVDSGVYKRRLPRSGQLEVSLKQLKIYRT